LKVGEGGAPGEQLKFVMFTKFSFMKKVFVLIVLIPVAVTIIVGITGILFLEKSESKLSKVEIAKNNALSRVLKEDKENDTFILTNKSDYQIIYFKKNDEFLISILKSPFEQLRKTAEKEFFEMTESDKAIICQLNVVITTPLFANPELAGQIFRLSFCQS